MFCSAVVVFVKKEKKEKFEKDCWFYVRKRQNKGREK